ncbi:MAG: hypothetical protein KZQ83_08300 [gamma proteobacterium symbiont of Taylorina sp.]|nr:hypothetical protein [gamma proteobacterium symbiont of Taylorina sp.]
MKRWVFFIPVIIGIIAIILLKQNTLAPKQKPLQEYAKSVRTFSILQVSVAPTAIGYGTVQPVTTWEAVAQVEGIITKKHPLLAKGAIIEKGSVLLQVDPTDYELKIAQIEADILANKAQLDELEVRLDNTQDSLDIEKKSLELTRKELQRLQRLVKQGGVSFSDVETQERIMLAQQQSVQSQNSSLKLFPSQRALLEAQLLQKQSQLETARRDLNNTHITIPFTGRISADNIELDQQVHIGNIMVTADALDKVEIEIQIPIRYFRGLLSSNNGVSINLLDLSNKQNVTFALKAKVVLREGGISTSWDARFARISDTLDPKTRTVGVIVEVDNPYKNVLPGSRPPLIKGFFVEVHLTGVSRPDSLVIPRSALHNQHLYFLNKDNRLEIRKINVDLFQAEFAIVSGEINKGDNIIISDLVPAIEGMLLLPHADIETAERLENIITGTQQ